MEGNRLVMLSAAKHLYAPQARSFAEFTLSGTNGLSMTTRGDRVKSKRSRQSKSTSQLYDFARLYNSYATLLHELYFETRKVPGSI